MAKEITKEEYEQFKKDVTGKAIKVTELYPNGDYNILYKINQVIFMCMEVYIDEDNKITYWVF